MRRSIVRSPRQSSTRPPVWPLRGGLHWPGYGNLRTVADPLSRTTTYSLR
ncbi:hypothetical protein [Singulisphaera acidiphila]|nr:hypothetical protein [Singulisphaera acidiphila]